MSSAGAGNQGPPQPPHGLPQGHPQGHPQGLPQGYPQGLPQGYPQGLPQGYPQGLHQGHLQGLPQGHLQGLPQGHLQGLPQGCNQAPLQTYGPQQPQAAQVPANMHPAPQHAMSPSYQQWPAGSGSPAFLGHQAPPAAAYYVQFPAAAGTAALKRKPGRPKGSLNKKKASNDEEEDDPPARRTRRSASARSGFEDVEIPFVSCLDFEEIPSDDKAACSKCKLNKAIFLIFPCGCYGFCKECLENQRRVCEDEDVKIKCIACERDVEEFVRYFRTTMRNAQEAA